MEWSAAGAGAWVAALLVAASPLAAQDPASAPPSPAPPVDSLLAWAGRSSPELAAQRARAAARRAQAPGEAAWPDPMLEVALRDAGFPDYTVGQEEMSMIEFDLRAPLPFPGARRARGRAAEATGRTETERARALERRLGGAIRSAYARIYIADRRARALRSARDLLRVLETTAAARYSTGQTDLEPVARAQVVRSRVEAEIDDLAARRRVEASALYRLVGLAPDAPFGEIDALPASDVPEIDRAGAAVDRAPAVHVARAAVAAAELRVASERHTDRPDLFAGAAYGYRGDLDPVVTFRLGAELPIWRGGRVGPAVQAAEAELAAARAELRAAELDVRAEVEALAAEWDRADAIARRNREAILPQSRTALEAARAAYESGRGDLSTVVEDFLSWIEAEQALATAEAERFAAGARLDAVLMPLTEEEERR